ncbi:uncharacterized protein FFB14_15307 [Fusarium fujikuroi]|nr:uncharacterized protein FFB14_15307 [Fusarium fujikuroi]
MEPNDLVPGYQQDDTLKLDIIEIHHAALSPTESVVAQATQVITATMSPVMLVKLKTPNAPNMAILKLYDRRASKDVDDHYSVHSILLQFIPGWSLWDLPESPSSSTSQQEWTSIVQRVVQGADEINKRDIILNDSCPRNVIVEADSHQPFIIDLAHFKDQLFKDWEHFGFSDGQEDWTPEGEWSESVRSLDNPGSIGLPIQSKLERIKGFLIDVKYPE